MPERVATLDNSIRVMVTDGEDEEPTTLLYVHSEVAVPRVYVHVGDGERTIMTKGFDIELMRDLYVGLGTLLPAVDKAYGGDES